MLAMLLMNRMTAKRRNARGTTLKSSISSSGSYCRTCLATEKLVSIFYSRDAEQKRSEDLKLVTGLDIKLNDGLSQKICAQCLETFNRALQFRRTSKKAEKALLGMLTGTKRKEKISKVIKVPKKARVKEAKVEKFDYDDLSYEPKDCWAKGETDDYAYEITFDGDDDNDFNNDDAYEDKTEEMKSKVKQKSLRKDRRVLPNGGMYKCGTCNKEFRMKATYKAHMRFHTNYCVCEACGKRCRNNNQLQEHKRARHGLSKVHKCAYCEYSSATKEALTIHERRHTGERPYVCDHCGATFHRRSNLVQHIAIHLPDKNFQCSVCPKREKSRKLLAIHEHKYHKENRYRYVCPICGDTFTRPGNVRQHLVRSHAVTREHQGVIEKVQIQVAPATVETKLPIHPGLGIEINSSNYRLNDTY